MTTGFAIERTILAELPEVRLIWAETVAAASWRCAGLPISLFVVDIFLPDGSGLDFLWNRATTHPDAKAIVMTASAVAEHAFHAAALNVLHLVEKPIAPAALLTLLRGALNLSEQSEGGKDFGATLKNVTPADVVQLKCLTRATTVVEFNSEGRTGSIRIEEGEVTDAVVGDVHGPDAVFEIIGWKRGEMHERPCVGIFERTINCSWQGLLMEAAQRVDEKAAT